PNAGTAPASQFPFDATGAGEGQLSAFRRLAPCSSASRASVQPCGIAPRSISATVPLAPLYYCYGATAYHRKMLAVRPSAATASSRVHIVAAATGSSCIAKWFRPCATLRLTPILCSLVLSRFGSLRWCYNERSLHDLESQLRRCGLLRAVGTRHWSTARPP